MLTAIIDGLAFATESLAGIFQGQGSRQQLIPLLRISFSTSFVLGVILALVFIFFPNPLFGLLTNHLEVIDNLHHNVSWLLTVLGFGSVAFVLDGYFLGLTEGSTLRNAALIAALVGVSPIAIAAWQFHSSSLSRSSIN